MLLGDEARMNRPGIAEGNWNWQADEKQIAEVEHSVAAMLMGAGRFNGGEAVSPR